MVSEGVDIPRLAVGVYATSVGTALFFAQAVGRFVRARRRGETASVFLPSIPSLLGYAAELEAERDHILSRADDATEDERALAEALRQHDTADELDQEPFQALAASAHFDRVLYDGNEFGVTAEEEDFLGLPGLLEPEQVALLLRESQTRSAGWPRHGRYRARARREPGRPAGTGADDPRDARRAAQGAERPHRRLASSHWPAARGDPRGAPAQLRRPAAAAGHSGSDPRPDRDDAQAGALETLSHG